MTAAAPSTEAAPGTDCLAPVEVLDGQTRHWQLGPLHIWLTRTASEWQIQSLQEPGEETVATADDRPAPEIDRRRWLTSVPGNQARLVPMTPDRPLIVRPEMPLEIGSGTEATVYVLIPCWFRIVVGNAPGEVLTELPSVVLSNSWFGGPTGGELCYGMRTTARRSLADVTRRPHRAICAVRLRNDFSRHLGVDRLCLRTAPLSIYRAADGRVWTTAVTVRQIGEAQRGEITYGEGPPPDAPDAVELSGPRAPRGSWLSAARFFDLASFIR